ncbi:MAG: hypothetical protein COT15_01020 [Candidatus Diapherotrites archaeon CG08_land_8_20_14_0_20_34_12]|nr:MAG: hypothetical protein COT15_01020 [Candidatus Diapherotrites archaeon CG08_land_8_20_14_0_20_34_12]
MSRGMTSRKRPWLTGITGKKARTHSGKYGDRKIVRRKRSDFVNWVARKIISRIRGDRSKPLYKELIVASAVAHGINPEVLLREIESRGFKIIPRPKQTRRQSSEAKRKSTII